MNGKEHDLGSDGLDSENTWGCNTGYVEYLLKHVLSADVPLDKPAKRLQKKG